MITIVAVCDIKPEGKEKFLDLALSLVESTRKETGNVSYNLYHDLNNPNQYTFIENWKDQEAIDQHNASVHFTSFVKNASPYFVGPLKINLYENLT